MRLGLTSGGRVCLGLVAVLAAAAYNADLNLLYLMVATLLVALLVSFIFAARAVAGVQMRRELPDEITAQIPFRVRVWLERKGHRVARWGTVSVEERMVNKLGAQDMFCFFPNVPAKRAVLAGYQAVAAHRGEYHLKCLRLVSRFPFGLAWVGRKVNVVDTFVAFPRRGRLLRPPRFALPTGPSPRQARHLERGAEFRSLRDFQPGDNPRLINWRISAKRGILQLKQLEDPAALDRVTLLLDTWLPDDAAPAAVARFELGISFAATLVEYFTALGQGVALIWSNGRMSPSTDRRLLLCRLALIGPAGDAQEALLEADEKVVSRARSPIIVVLHDPARAATVCAAHAGARMMCYSPGLPEFESVFRLSALAERVRS